MTYKYLYQDSSNHNCEGEIVARNREDAYHQLRLKGIRPYRLIGDDPVRWQPWAISIGYVILLALVIVLVLHIGAQAPRRKAPARIVLTAEEARIFREKAEDAVYRAPEAYRYNVWKGVNARLAERGLEPIPRPDDLVEE